MSISRLLADAGLFVITDTRAKRRLTDRPETLKIQFLPEEDTMAAIAQASALHPCPLALILSSGQALVLSEGGKGGIAVQGSEGSLTAEQQEALAIAQAAISSLYGLQAKPKRSKKAQPEPEEQPAEEPEAASDAEPEA